MIMPGSGILAVTNRTCCWPSEPSREPPTAVPRWPRGRHVELRRCIQWRRQVQQHSAV